MEASANQAQEKVQEAAGQAKDRAREQVDQRSTQAGEQVTGSAADLRSVAEHLRSEGKDQPGRLAEQAADRAERLGEYLKDSDADRILHDVEDFGRRQPLAVVAGGLALGFVASRFLKASSQTRATGNGTAPAQRNGHVAVDPAATTATDVSSRLSGAPPVGAVSPGGAL